MLAGSLIHQLLFIGLMASVFIVLAKWAAHRSGIAGLQRFMDAV